MVDEPGSDLVALVAALAPAPPRRARRGARLRPPRDLGRGDRAARGAHRRLSSRSARATSSGKVIFRLRAAASDGGDRRRRRARRGPPRCRCPRSPTRPRRGGRRGGGRHGTPAESVRRRARRRRGTSPVVSRPARGHHRDRAAVLAGGGQRRLEERGPGQRAGAVVDRDQVELAGLDGGREVRSAAHSDACRVAPPSTSTTSASPRCGASASATALRSSGRMTSTMRRTSVGGEGVAHRPGEDGPVAEGEQDLVDVGSDAGARAGGDDDDGGGHGVSRRSGRPGRPAAGSTREVVRTS